MICKSCGKKMEYIERDYAPDTFDCECGEWIEASIAFNEMKARAEKAEGELLSLKERLGVEDCNYCHEQKENEIKEIREEAEALSEKLVRENQELGIKLAKTEGELKAIKEKYEQAQSDLKCIRGYFEIISYEVNQHDDYAWTEPLWEPIEEIEKILKQIGGEK